MLVTERRKDVQSAKTTLDLFMHFYREQTEVNTFF